jgi:hypothetical protein
VGEVARRGRGGGVLDDRQGVRREAADEQHRQHSCSQRLIAGEEGRPHEDDDGHHDISDDDNIAYIMEKPNPSEFRGKIKDGIHIVFPHIIVNNNIQHFIRTKILEKGIDIFNIPDICSLYEDIVDKAIRLSIFFFNF